MLYTKAASDFLPKISRSRIFGQSCERAIFSGLGRGDLISNIRGKTQTCSMSNSDKHIARKTNKVRL